jgi:hypothetical protein
VQEPLSACRRFSSSRKKRKSVVAAIEGTASRCWRDAVNIEERAPPFDAPFLPQGKQGKRAVPLLQK